MQRTAVITGSSRGIGRATALLLGKAGYNIVINYLKEKEAAQSVLKELGNFTRAIAVQADVRKHEDVHKLYGHARAAFGFVDTVVNNAGISMYGLLCDETEANYDAICDTHIKGAFLVTREFLPDMISNRFGRIINISSMWGVVGSANESLYSAAKSAQIGFTKSLSKELASCGITVNAIAPGVINTDMVKDLDESTVKSLIDETPVGRIGEPEDVARAVKFFADKESSFITGQVLAVTGGFAC